MRKDLFEQLTAAQREDVQKRSKALLGELYDKVPKDHVNSTYVNGVNRMCEELLQGVPAAPQLTVKESEARSASDAQRLKAFFTPVELRAANAPKAARSAERIAAQTDLVSEIQKGGGAR